MKALLSLICTSFLMSCSSPIIERIDIIGEWKSIDSEASISFYADGSCSLRNLDYYILSTFPEYKEVKLNSEAKWSLVDKGDNMITGGVKRSISISYQIPDREAKGNLVFYISGQGFLENKPPWDLYLWIGDPDDWNKYLFKKE